MEFPTQESEPATLWRVQEELAERTAELRALVGNIGDFIARFDRELRHLFVNRAFLDAIGLPAEQVIGRTNEELGMPAELCRFWRENQMKVFATGREEVFEFEFQMPDGLVHCYRSKVVPERKRDGQVATIVGIVRDITPRKHAEHETRALRRQLVHATRVGAMGELTSSLVHELSQPLTAILANAQAGQRLLRGALPDWSELRAILDDIVADEQRASSILDRVRRMLVKDQLEQQPIALDELLQEVTALVRREVATENAAVSFDFAADVPAVTGDRIQLQQVILNLLLNALDAMKEPPAPVRRIRLRTRRLDPQNVAVDVEDTGRGVAEGDLERIFEPFFTSKHQGLGMGLSISRGIVEAHGGRLVAHNNDGPGMTFTLILPRHAVPT